MDSIQASIGSKMDIIGSSLRSNPTVSKASIKLSPTISKAKKILRATGLMSGSLNKTKKKKKNSYFDGDGMKKDFESVSVYNVTLDSNVPPGMEPSLKEEETVGSEESEYLIRVLLLVMDGSSHRFEIIQLVFDPASSLVQEALKQISSTVSDDSLRKINYKFISSMDGVVFDNKKLFRNYFPPDSEKHHVAVALPTALDSERYLKLAKPILKNEEFNALVEIAPTDGANNKSNEMSVDKDGETKGDEDTEINVALNDRNMLATADSKTTTNNSSIRFSIHFFIVLYLSAVSAYLAHKRISSPLGHSEILKPGRWKNGCGLLHSLHQVKQFELIPEQIKQFELIPEQIKEFDFIPDQIKEFEIIPDQIKEFEFIPKQIRDCHSETLYLDKQGVLSLSDDDKVIWKMTSDCSEECSAMVTDNGQIMIGNEVAFIFEGKYSPKSTISTFAMDLKKPKRKKLG